MGKGLNNPKGFKDDYTDVMPAYKRDAQANKGEFYVSKETGKLSLKVNKTTIKRYLDEDSLPEIPSPYTPPFKSIFIKIDNPSSEQTLDVIYSDFEEIVPTFYKDSVGIYRISFGDFDVSNFFVAASKEVVDLTGESLLLATSYSENTTEIFLKCTSTTKEFGTIAYSDKFLEVSTLFLELRLFI